MKKIKKTSKGFTLVELIIVIAVLGILASIAVVKYSNVTKNAKAKKVLGDCKAIETATQLYRVDTGEWPRFTGTGNTNKEAYLDGNGVEGWKGPYLDKWPLNPFNTGAVESDRNYQLDYRNINKKKYLVVEISLNGLKHEEVENITSFLDKEIDKENGKNNGKIQWTNDYVCWIIESEPEGIKGTSGNLVEAH